MEKKILLIEDDRPTIEIYQEILLREGFNVEVIDTGADALKRLKEIKEGKEKKPDLVLLDLLLPDINGNAILKEAKEDNLLKDIPFFVLTNYSDPASEKESRELGAEEYFIKTSLAPSQIIKIVKNFFEK